MTRLSILPLVLPLLAAVTPAGGHGTASTAEPDNAARHEIAARAAALLDAAAGPAGVVERLYGVSRSELLGADFDAPSRRDWSYRPRARSGLALGRMTAGQRRGAHRLLRSVLSARGYLKAVHIMKLEEVLAGREVDGFDRGAEHYHLTIFGRPGDAPWGLSFEGHHLSVNLTMTAAGASVTPSFFGAAPATETHGALAGFAPLGAEQALAFALLRSLDDAQRSSAILSREAPGDVLSSPFGADDPDGWKAALTRDGLPATRLDPRQARLLDALLAEVTGGYRAQITPADAAPDRDALRFAWLGARERHAPHYFRVQGDTFVYEFDAAGDDGNHVHTVWRDREDDFGAALLERHYRERRH